MESPSQLVKFLLTAGNILLLAGIIVWLFGNKLSWLGKLPGDIRIERENFRLYIPITTMIILSVLLSLIIRLIKNFF